MKLIPGQLYKTNTTFLVMGVDKVIPKGDIVVFIKETYIPKYDSYITIVLSSKGLFNIRHISKNYIRGNLFKL